MKHLLLALLFVCTGAVAAPQLSFSLGTETMTLHSEKGDCKQEKGFDVKRATYSNLDGGLTAEGCYALTPDGKLVMVILKNGPAAYEPLVIPAKVFKPLV